MTIAPQPLPPPALPKSDAPAPAYAQQAAVFSVAVWLFFISAAYVGMGGNWALPPVFVLLLLSTLAVGLALGIIGAACSGKRLGILIPSIIGITLNGVVLLVILCGVLSVLAHGRVHRSGQGTQGDSAAPLRPSPRRFP